MGSEMYVKNQYVKEATRGTPIATTKRWLGTINVPKDREPYHGPYTLGQRARSFSTEILQLLADPITLATPAGAYYQALPLLYGMTLKGGVTPTEVTPSQNDYLYDWTPSLTAAAAPDTATLQVGDNDQCYQIPYVMGKTIDLSWASGENKPAEISCEAFGQFVSKSTFTASILPLPINLINGNSAKIWIDSTWATLGTTPKTGLMRSGQIQIATGNHPKPPSGQNYFSNYGEGFLEVSGSFVFEGGADAIARWDDFAAGTHRAVRVSFTGPQIGTGTNYSLIYDMFVAFDEVIPLSGFAEGNTLYAVTFMGISDNLATPKMLGVKATTNNIAW